MDFINQIKKLKDLTKSPEVKELCESYLNGDNKLDPESFFTQVNEENSNLKKTESYGGASTGPWREKRLSSTRLSISPQAVASPSLPPFLPTRWCGCRWRRCTTL
jgi:hypothetical protein